MKWMLCVWLAQGVQPAASEPAPAPTAVVAAYAGTLRAGRLELAQLSKLEKHDDARRVGESLLAKPDWDAAPESERAETLYAIGVAQGRAANIPEAVEAFHRARGLAGSSPLGRDAAYNAGTYLLLAAEEVRRSIPEVREKLKLPPLPPQPTPSAPSGPGGQAQPAPDALATAREAYLAARGELIGAWRGASSEGDTRANLELVQRRLRELDELEKQREEQEQQQQDPEQDPQKGDSGDSKDDQPKPEESEKQDPEQQQKPEDSPKPEEQPKDEPKPEDQPDPAQQDEQKEAQPDKSREEMLMTPEEVQRLLDRLAEIDEKAEEIQALLRSRRRAPVKKDW